MQRKSAKGLFILASFQTIKNIKIAIQTGRDEPQRTLLLGAFFRPSFELELFSHKIQENTLPHFCGLGFILDE